MENLNNSTEQFKVRDQYLSQLAIHSRETLSRYLTEDQIGRLETRTAEVSECRTTQNLLEEHIFSLPEYNNLCDIMRNDKLRFRELTNEHVKSFLDDRKDLIGGVLQKGVVPILVRPETFHLTYRITAFLKERGFEIVSMKTQRIGLEKYWAIYEHVFGDPIKENHVRRRAFGYINRPACLLIIKHKNSDNSRECADLITKKHKGIAGIKDNNTLRGGLIYDEISAILNSNNKKDLFALDPLMEYVYNDQTKYDEGIKSVFHANLPGVHIPDS